MFWSDELNVSRKCIKKISELYAQDFLNRTQQPSSSRKFLKFERTVLFHKLSIPLRLKRLLEQYLFVSTRLFDSFLNTPFSEYWLFGILVINFIETGHRPCLYKIDSYPTWYCLLRKGWELGLLLKGQSLL